MIVLIFLLYLEVSGNGASANRCAGWVKSVFSWRPQSFSVIPHYQQRMRRQRQGDDGQVWPWILSAASLKESRSDGRQGWLVRLEMTTRWQWSGFRVKVLGGVWMRLKTHPSSYTIMSGGRGGQSFSILMSHSIVLRSDSFIWSAAFI